MILNSVKTFRVVMKTCVRKNVRHCLKLCDAVRRLSQHVPMQPSHVSPIASQVRLEQLHEAVAHLPFCMLVDFVNSLEKM